MQAPYPFDSVLAFGFLSFLLLIGVALRAKVGLLQRFLFPSCLIGGVIGLVLVSLFPLGLEHSRLEAMAYHFFNLSFISVGLTREADKETRPYKGKDLLKGATWMALIQGMTFPLQAMIGGLIVIGLGYVGMELFPTFGFLAPLGFNEGPGQALSFGKVWEGMGFAHGATIGLSFAAIGFAFSFFVGVPLVNYGIRKGFSTHGRREIPRDFLTGVITKGGECEPAGSLTLHSGNVETLAFQAALTGLVYMLTYFVVKFISGLLGPDLGAMLWGFCFFFGLLIALAVGRLMKTVGVDHLLDPGVQRRITGLSVDFLIVSTITAIQIQVIREYLFPILLISLLAGVLTTMLVVYFGRRLGSYNLERAAAIYGVVTGTVSCGLLLLRIVDPEFKTPAAFEVAIMNVFVAPIILGCTILVNSPVLWGWNLGLTVLIYLGVMLASMTAARMLKLWGPKRV